MTVRYSTHYTNPATELDWDWHDLDHLPESTRKFLRDADDRGVDVLLLDEINFPKVVLASFNALGEDSIDVANIRWAADYGQGTEVWSIWGYSQSWYFDPMLPPEPEVLDDILDVLEGYREYPVFDEDEWSQVEQEWFDEYVWEPYISRLPISSEDKVRLAEAVLDGSDYYWVAHEGYLRVDEFRELVREMFDLDLPDN